MVSPLLCVFICGSGGRGLGGGQCDNVGDDVGIGCRYDFFYLLVAQESVSVGQHRKVLMCF